MPGTTRWCFSASHGYRCIAHDRRGHGRSSQPWNGNEMDTYADDLATLVEALDLRERDPRRSFHRRRRGRPLHRPTRHEARRQSRADRRGAAADAEDGGRSRRAADRSLRRHSRGRPGGPLAVLQGPQRPVLRRQPAGAKVSQGVRDSFWLQGMQAGFKGVVDCIKAFSETDFTEDLKKFDVPTLIMHGDDDQIVPIGASAMLSSKLVKGATLKVYPGLPHGMCHRQQGPDQRRPAGVHQGMNVRAESRERSACS